MDEVYEDRRVVRIGVMAAAASSTSAACSRVSIYGRPQRPGELWAGLLLAVDGAA